MKRWSPPAACLFAILLGPVVAREPTTEEKLDAWIVPEVAMENLTLPQAVAWIREQSRALDPEKGAAPASGLRIGYERRSFEEPARFIRFQAEKISLGDLLEEVARQSARTVEVFEDGVVLLRPKPDTEARDGMVTRTFWIPPSYLNNEKVPEDDPFAGGRPEKKKITSQLVREVLEENGIKLPDGSSIVATPGTNDLGVLSHIMVRTSVPTMELVEAYFTTLDGPGSGPLTCVVQVESYALANDNALAVTSGRVAGFDGRPILREIGALKEKGEAELVGLANIVTRSGQRAKVEQGVVRRIVTGYVASEGKDLAQTDTVYSGIVLEVDPIVGADGRTIELNIAVDASPEEPDLRTKEILAPVSGKPVRIDEYQSWGGKLLTALTVRDGEPQLLGVIPAGNKTDKAQVVLVTVWLRSGREGFPVPE